MPSAGEDAAAPGARCSRADCTSLREELELLRGDLLELEGENEQLHDQVASLQAEASAKTQQTQQQLLKKNEEIETLKETVAGLSTRLETRDKELQELQNAAKKAENPKTPTLDQETAALNKTNQELEQKLRELQSQVEREATAGLAAKRQVAQVEEETKDKRSELYTALKENEVLRAENVEVQEALKKASEQVKELEALVQGLQDQVEAYKEAVDEQTLEITQVHARMAEMEQEKVSVEAKLIEMDEQESDVNALMSDARAKFDMEKAVLTAEVDELKRKLKQQQLLREQQRVQQSKEVVRNDTETDAAAKSSLEDLEKQLEMLQELRVRDKGTILELNQRVLQQQSDLESLAEHLDVDKLVESAVQNALHKQSSKQDAVEQECLTLKRRLKEQRELVQDLEFKQGIVEKQLTEAQEWNEKFEQGAGLEDVVKYQKKLRAQLDQQLQTNMKLRQELNDQVEAAGKLFVAFERLKSEAGKPTSFEYDDLAIDNHLKGQLAINEAVMKQMEVQIHDLETERLRFLQKLRDQARMTGGKLYEQHGLTTEQLSAVEEFIDRVKHTPELAKRILQTDSGPPRKDGGESQSANDTAEDLSRQLKATTEENAQLLKEIGHLNHELEVAQTEASAVAPVATPEVETAHDVGNADGRAEILRTLEAVKAKSQRQEGVIYHLRDEITSLRKEREEWKAEEKRLAKDPLVINAELRSNLQDHEAGEVQSRVHEETQTTDTKVGKNAKQTQEDNGDVASLSSTDEEGVTAVVKKKRGTSKRGEHSTVNRSPEEIPTTNEKTHDGLNSQADNIALVVAKAIEAQFAMLQAQKGSILLADVPRPAVSTGDNAAKPTEVTITCTKVGDEQKDDGLDTVTSPRSPVSRGMLETFAFESEDKMVEQVDVLKELNVCLDELVSVEARNEELRQQMHQHEEVFQSLMDQHTLLYQHFFQMHAQYSNAEIRIRNELEQQTQENKDWKLKCQRYEAGLHILGVQNQQNLTSLTSDSLVSGNETQFRSQVIELTKKVATYEVNEARHKRKYQQLHKEWQGSTEHNKLLQQEWSEMEKTLKYRILYLETWKQGADEMMERMEKTLQKSVLREFADKQQRTITDVFKKYSSLNEAYAEMHAKYLQLYDLPIQLSRMQHDLMVLQAEKNARGGSKSVDANPVILQQRIDQLENEVDVQAQRIKELEEAERAALVSDELVQSTRSDDVGVDNELRSENALLYERINEVEQLYEGLALECSKYKDIATLAASQANVLSKRATQEKGNREQQEEQLRELMASSEDHAIVGELQHQLMQIKATHQQFLIQYDLVTETQQQTLLKSQRLELEMERKAQELSSARERSSDRVQTLESSIGQVKERDWMARNSKWEAFRKRLDALEDEMQVEQQRRKKLEKDLEDRQVELPLLDRRQQRCDESEVGKLKSRIGALETRERLLMGQLEAAAKSGSREREEHLHIELRDSKVLNEDLMRQLEAIQSRIAELLRLNGELEAEKRQLRCKYEDLELELQYARSGIRPEGGRREQGNQREMEHGASHSPLMRQKVGLYEKDQAELQQAAQATIASLKQLVEEKNTVINEYQRKIASVRATSAHDKAQDRLETTQLNKKLYEENQRMIGQLKEAMSTISNMERSGKGKQALQAAQERHDHVLQEWKQAEIALEGAKQTVRELQMELEVLRNERDLAEARAGEALEEIVLLKEKVGDGEKQTKQLENQIAFVKRDMAKKEEKLKLLRDAIIKLKEEFLKAEDRHAIEIAKAQHSMNQDFNTRKRKEKERREEEEDEWREEKTRLQSQVQMLQEKMALLKKKQDQQQRKRKKPESEEKEEKDSVSENVVQMLKDEIERLKRLLKDKVVGESRAVEELEKKIKILQAQNLALREASVAAPTTAPVEVDEKTRRETLDAERKLQRRVDILMLRLKEKQADVTSKDSELERCNERITKLQSELQSKEQLAQTPTAPTAPSAPMKMQLEELERQNSFLQETLALKRKEWEESFTSQMEKYETQLQRLRRRLVQHGLPLEGEDGEEGARGAPPNSRLQREEQQFLVGQEVREELLILGDELRNKEQEMVAKDTKLLELELEVESLRLEYKRLNRKNPRGADSGSMEHDPAKERRTKGGGRGSSWAAHERQELEEVIENMKKVIEKLRAENEKLKNAAAKQTQVSPERLDSLRRKLKEQKEVRERLETQLDKLQNESGELKKDKLKLQQKLRAKSAPSSSSRESAALGQLKEKDQQLLQAEQELAELRHQVLQLEVQLERNTPNEDEEDTKREQTERIKELQAQVLELEDENTKLTNELAAFDEDFFEEIEDLKYKYAQAVRDKRQLEKRLARSTASGGISPASTSSRRSRRD